MAFVKVDTGAFRLFRKLEHIGVAWRLYELGDQNRWGPFRCSDSFLTVGDISKRHARYVITELEANGLLRIIRAGDRHNARVIQMIDPGTTNVNAGIEFAEHGNDAKTTPIKKSVPPPVPPPVPQTELKYQTTDKTPEPDIENDSLSRAAVLSPAIIKKLSKAGLTSESVSALSRAELAQREGLGKKSVESIAIWAEANGTPLRPNRPKAARASADPKVKALGDIWGRQWLDRRGARYSWDWHKDANIIKRWGECCGWDEDTFAASVALYHDAEDGKQWPDRAAGLSKAAHNMADWANAAKTAGKKRRKKPTKTVPDYWQKMQDQKPPTEEQRQMLRDMRGKG